MTLTIASHAKQAAVLALALAFGQTAGLAPAAAAAGNATGSSALAVAAVVVAHFSVVGSYDKRALARLFSGQPVNSPPNRKITVAADSVMCKVSNVDLTSRSCELTYKGGKRNLTGREANELYATLAVAGVTPEGAAGSMIESITKLACTIDLAMIKQKDGSGAECTYEAE
jgi:hypothetical protein